jgi:5-hydroxyisourate hydrolase
MPREDPITCHVLDTSSGRPAAGIRATLSLTSPPSSASYIATTDTDGRIANWVSSSSHVFATISSLIASHGGPSVWKITFDTAGYYGAGKTFFPLVELSFVVQEGEHFHVPLLLGPYTYTTYRGS